MIFVTGPLYAGKRTYACRLLGIDPSTEALDSRVLRDAHDLAASCSEADLDALAASLAARYEVVIATEVGAGVVPVDPVERRNRERAGRLACLLAERATTVVRLCCGIPQLLKGDLPC